MKRRCPGGRQSSRGGPLGVRPNPPARRPLDLTINGDQDHDYLCEDCTAEQCHKSVGKWNYSEAAEESERKCNGDDTGKQPKSEGKVKFHSHIVCDRRLYSSLLTNQIPTISRTRRLFFLLMMPIAWPRTLASLAITIKAMAFRNTLLMVLPDVFAIFSRVSNSSGDTSRFMWTVLDMVHDTCAWLCDGKSAPTHAQPMTDWGGLVSEFLMRC